MEKRRKKAAAADFASQSNFIHNADDALVGVSLDYSAIAINS